MYILYPTPNLRRSTPSRVHPLIFISFCNCFLTSPQQLPPPHFLYSYVIYWT